MNAISNTVLRTCFLILRRWYLRIFRQSSTSGAEVGEGRARLVERALLAALQRRDQGHGIVMLN